MRRKALSIYRKNWTILLLLASAQSAVAFLLFGLIASCIKLPILSLAYSVVVSTLVHPFFLGITCIYLNSWRGTPIKLGDCISFYCATEKLIPALKLGFFLATLQFGYLLPSILLKAILPDIPQSEIVTYWLSSLLHIVLLCFMLRMFLADFLLIGSHRAPIGESYVRMRGMVLRTLGFILSLYLWIVPIFLIISLALNLVGGVSVTVISPLTAKWANLIIIPFAPFVGVAMAGYADDVLLKPEPSTPNKVKIKDVYRK